MCGTCRRLPETIWKLKYETAFLQKENLTRGRKDEQILQNQQCI